MEESRITYRPIEPEDLPFLSRLYASTRLEELAPLPWSEEQKRDFLQFQFHAQHAFYQQQFPDGDFRLLLFEGKPAGRLYLDRRSDEIRLVDIALLPEHRGQGLGGGLVRKVLEEAGDSGKSVRIHVEYNNPAIRLYNRLGFRKIETNGVYHLMEWRRAPQ